MPLFASFNLHLRAKSITILLEPKQSILLSIDKESQAPTEAKEKISPFLKSCT